jgi:hypothetical protein
MLLYNISGFLFYINIAMSDILLHTEKKHKENIFNKLVEDEYELCRKEINRNIGKGMNQTIYIVTITKIQKEWKPLLGTYMVLCKLRNDDFKVQYLKPTTLIIRHFQKKTKYRSNKKILKELNKEDHKTRTYYYKKNYII